MRERSRSGLPAAGVLVAGLPVVSGFLLDRRLSTGAAGRLLAAVAPFVAGIQLSPGFARAPFADGFRFARGFVALFRATSSASVLPAFGLPVVDTRLARAVRRALVVGIPAAVGTFATA